MNAQELKQKSVEELRAELLKALREQFNLRMQKATGQLTQTHLLKQTKRTIARIETVIAQKQGEAA